MSLGRLPRTLAILAASVAGLGACGRSPQDKIVGWPPREPIVPLGAAVEDVIEDVAPAPDVAPDTAAAAVDVAPEVPPCRRIVDLVCELEGRFTDACREARSNVPDDSHAETRAACAELFARFSEHDLGRVGSACHKYASEVCRVRGDRSEPCKTARGQTSVLTSRRELRACLGDLLWIQTLTFRR